MDPLGARLLAMPIEEEVIPLEEIELIQNRNRNRQIFRIFNHNIQLQQIQHFNYINGILPAQNNQ